MKGSIDQFDLSCMIQQMSTFLAALMLFISCFISCNTSKETEQAQTESQNQQTEEKAKQNLPSENMDDKPVQKASKARSMLIGKWEWEKTICCGRKPEIMKPGEDKKTQYLKFQEDSTVLFYKDDELEKRKTYEVKGGTLVNNVPQINIEGQQPGILRITEDELVLDYSYIDLQTEYYQKVR